MSRASAGYEIAKATGVCAASGKKIETGEEFVAVLVELGGDEEAVLQRRDFKVAAWEKGARPKAPLKVFGHWRAKMHPPGSKKGLIDDAALIDLFEQLEGAEEPSRVSFRFVLALILIRKKLLKYEGTCRDSAGPRGGAVMMVRRATRSGETPAEVVEVLDPQMDDAAVKEAVEQLGAVMAGGAGGAG